MSVIVVITITDTAISESLELRAEDILISQNDKLYIKIFT